MIKKTLICLSLFFLIACLSLFFFINKKNTVAEETLFEVKPGNSVNAISRNLHKQNLIASKFVFKAYVRLLNKGRSLRSGEFTIPAHQSVRHIVTLLTAGKTKQYSFTIIEGSSFKELVKQINTIDNISNKAILQNHAELLAAIDATEKHPEGLFLADTYYYTKGTSAKSILQRSYQAMQTLLAEAWPNRDTSSPIKTPYEALILASIIEKETGIASERPEISGVFINRLRKGMRLQTDPTVIYGIGDAYDGDIKYKDLRTDTPYNTYTRYGLPPTPIAMSGKAAILAALHPKATESLFFVATGDGGHTFTKTLKEHEAAVKVYLKKTQ